MKKYYSEIKYKRFSRIRKGKDLARIRRRNKLIKLRGRSSMGLTAYQRWEKSRKTKAQVVTAPEVFSFLNNPDGVIGFLNEIRLSARKGRNVFIDLSDIKEFTPETVAILLSKIANKRFTYGMQLSGNSPDDPRLAKIFVQSGFYAHVQTRQKPPSKGFSLIHRKSNKMVHGKQANELIEFATKNIFGNPRQAKGIYRVLLEAMMNTHGHASRDEDAIEPWWAMVYFDPDSRKAIFSFVDSGIGVFESIKVRDFKTNIELFVRLKNKGDLLKDLMKGKIGSRTGSARRGNGFPAMYSALKRGQVHNFVIVANDVYGNIATGETRILSKPFRGTFLYWELFDAETGKH